MYVNPFWLGVIATIAVETVMLIICAFVSAAKKK